MANTLIGATVPATGIAAHITVIDGQPTTTTRDIAQVFGKRHDHVLNIVRQRMEEAGAWGVPNFWDTPFTDEQNGQTYSVIRMTEKGFMFVVQKFTGKKAVQTQIAYVDEFERMRDALRQPAPEQLTLDYTRITPAQAQHLKELVQLVAASGKQTHGETWARLHRKMQVNGYLELPASRFDEACIYLTGKMDDASMAAMIQKHFPRALPQPAQAMTAYIPPDAQTSALPAPDHIASAFMAAQGAGAQVQKNVFNAVLLGNDDWKFQQWSVSFITDSKIAVPAIVQMLDADEFTTSMRRLTRDIEKTGGANFSSPELANLAAACWKGLAGRLEYADSNKAEAA